jgi:D-galactarolactone cycloisomerase
MTTDRIERIELFHVDVPLPTPLFPAWIPGYPLDHLRSTLLRVTTRDGLIGHATGLAFDREREGLGDFIGPFLLGLDPFERLRQSGFLGWRNAWMEVAFWDLAAKARGVPMWKLLGERIGAPMDLSPGPVHAYASFGEVRSPKARIETIERAQDGGFRGAKVRLPIPDSSEARDFLRMTRASTGDGFELWVHGHQGSMVTLVEDAPRWSLDDARAMLAVCRDAGVRWLQEPLGLDEFEPMRVLCAESPIPIGGGDIAPGPQTLRNLVERGGARLLTPDCTFTGMDTLLSLGSLCRDLGVRYSPSVYGDALSLMANLHLLVAWRACQVGEGPAWLEFPWDPPALVPEHRDALLEQPIHIEADGTLPVPTEPGLGVTIDDKALRRYAHRFYTLTPVRFAVSTARRSGLRQTAAFARTKRVEPERRAVGSDDAS